jgi:hypothetical protein
MENQEKPKIKWSKNRKFVAIMAILLIVSFGTYEAVNAILPFFVSPSTVNVPGGVTPTPTASPTPAPTETPTNTFTTTATMNGQNVPDPTHIEIPSGELVGTQFIIIYTFHSTANQPLTVFASVPADQQVTGNEQIVWDAATVSNGYSVPLSVGGTAQMTMTVTLGTVGGTIPLVFTSNP